jgi:cephalosporin hydroxylase
LRMLTHKHREVFVNVEHYDRLLQGEGQKLTLYSVLKPSVVANFRSVLILAANFPDSAAYHFWSRAGVNFKEDTALKEQLRYTTHPNGEPLRVFRRLFGLSHAAMAGSSSMA